MHVSLMVQAIHQKITSGGTSDEDVARHGKYRTMHPKKKLKENQGYKYNHPLSSLETQFFSIGHLVFPILQVSLIRSEP